MINSIIRCFDPFAWYRYAGAEAQGATGCKVAWWRQFLIYIGWTIVGAAVGPLIPALMLSS
jgi:hypothetical protein